MVQGTEFCLIQSSLTFSVTGHIFVSRDPPSHSPPCLAKGGGGAPGYPEFGHGLGGPYEKKILRDPGPNPHTVATIRKEFWTFHPRAPKWGTQLGGVGGSKSKNRGDSLGDHFVSQNDDFTRLK